MAPLLVLAAIVVAGVPAFVLLHWDDPPIDDSDLRIDRLELEPGTNGVELLDALAAGMWWPDERAAELAALRREDAWDAALAAEVVDRNRAALERIPDVLAAAHFQLHELVWEDDFPSAGESLDWQYPARVLAVRSLARARSGLGEQAFEDALAAVRLGARLRSASGSTLTVSMIGLASSNLGVEALERGLVHLELSAEESRRWTRALADARVAPEAWSAIWAREYESFDLLMDRLEDGQLDTEGSVSDGESTGSPYTFKPNATRQLFADFYRRMQRRGGGTCEDLDLLVPQPLDGPLQRARLLLGPNSIGRIIFQVAFPNFVSFELKRCSADTRLASARASIALRAYQSDHGALPETLDTLVPHYLADVPIDVFDASSLAYDRATRTLGRERAAVAGQRGAPSRFVLFF